MMNWLRLPVQASTHAAEIDQMTVLVHWLMLVLFVGWGAFFLFVLVRFRKGANPTASYAGAKGKFAKSTEVLVAIIEIVLLVGYAIPAWATRVADLPNEDEAVVVRVVGGTVRLERRSIRAVTAGSAGPTPNLSRPKIPSASIAPIRTAKTTSTTINQLNLPVDRPVLVKLSSKDVIHSFGLSKCA